MSKKPPNPHIAHTDGSDNFVMQGKILSAGQEIHCLVQNQKVHYRFHKSPTPNPFVPLLPSLLVCFTLKQ